DRPAAVQGEKPSRRGICASRCRQTNGRCGVSVAAGSAAVARNEVAVYQRDRSGVRPRNARRWLNDSFATSSYQPLWLGRSIVRTAITGTDMKAVARPMIQYLLVLCVAPVVLILVPSFSLWQPPRLDL